MKDRQYWVSTLTGIAEPVLSALAEGRLRQDMPVYCRPGQENDRKQFTYLEALGRTLCGLAPWLENPEVPEEEKALQLRFRKLAVDAIEQGTDPASPDFVNFTEGYQPLVDAAFLAHAILRAPGALWHSLSDRGRQQVIQALEATRDRKPFFCNWLLFSAMTEAALQMMTGNFDPMRVDYALRQHMQWYQGDGMYGDGPDFHWDYYNSYVIQPMLVDILEALGEKDPQWAEMVPAVHARATRFAAVQERMISPEGTFPPVGRSLAYRFGAFQHLAQMALQHRLPEDVSPAQVRCALTAVIRRTMACPGNMDARGWLTIGFCGQQPEVGENYISTGSLYLCTAVFLPLGLPAEDPFWAGPETPWTAVRAWSGGALICDHAL